MKFIFILGTMLLLGSTAPRPFPEYTPNEMPPNDEITLTILYDNYPYDPDFRNSWGFSCLIEGLGETILFDSGGEDGNLMHNLRAAGKEPSDIDLVVLSHIHWDHTGGLPELLASHTGMPVYMPASFPDDYRKKIRDLGARPVDITGPQQLSDHVWTSGEMGTDIIEQSLILETSRGSVVITGCAHPGIDDIVKKATELKGKQCLLVMGGFHLMRTNSPAVREIAEAFKSQEIRYVAPTHCSGDGTLEIFREIFGEACLPLGTGRIVRLADL